MDRLCHLMAAAVLIHATSFTDHRLPEKSAAILSDPPFHLNTGFIGIAVLQRPICSPKLPKEKTLQAFLLSPLHGSKGAISFFSSLPFSFFFPPFSPPSSFHFLLFSFSSFFFSSFSFLPFFPFLLFFFFPFLSFFKLVTIFSLKILQQFHLKENFVKSFSLWKEKISKRYYLKKKQPHVLF